VEPISLWERNKMFSSTFLFALCCSITWTLCMTQIPVYVPPECGEVKTMEACLGKNCECGWCNDTIPGTCYVLPLYVGDEDDDSSDRNRIIGRECEHIISNECKPEDYTVLIVITAIILTSACAGLILLFLSFVRERIRNGYSRIP